MSVGGCPGAGHTEVWSEHLALGQVVLSSLILYQGNFCFETEVGECTGAEAEGEVWIFKANMSHGQMTQSNFLFCACEHLGTFCFKGGAFVHQ